MKNIRLLAITLVTLTLFSQNAFAQNILLGDGSVRVFSAGPLQISAGKTSALIGLLLPAVQKIRGAVVIINSRGEIIFQQEVIPPTSEEGAPFQSHFHTLSINPRTNQLELGDGSVTKELGLTNGTELVAIGLLLPAVQKVREAANRNLPKTPIGSLQLINVASDTPIGLLPFIEQDNAFKLTQFLAKQSLQLQRK